MKRELFVVVVMSMVASVGKDTAVHRVQMMVVGVGYRVRLQDGKVLVFDVGLSHELRYNRPAGIEAKVDSTNTSFELVTKPELANAKSVLGNEVHKICLLRRRSPYTGNGIVVVGKAYPSLKSTKVAKK